MTKPIVNRVSTARVSRGLSQLALAEAAGVSRQTIHNVERGKVTPSVGLALALARVLEIPVTELFTERGLRISAEVVHLQEPGAGACRVVLGTVRGRQLAHALPKESATTSADAVLEAGRKRLRVELEAPPPETLFLAGCDPALALLAAQLLTRGLRTVWLPANSARARAELAAGTVHVAGVHAASSERVAAPPGVTVVRLARWNLGLVVATRDRRRLGSLHRVLEAGATFAMREAGSGAHAVVLEALGKSALGQEELGKERLTRLRSLAFPVRSHEDVAKLVALGAADAGVSLESAARAHALAFIPLVEHAFDLQVWSRELLASTPGGGLASGTGRLLEVLSSARFRAEARTLGGHDLRETGKVIAEA